MMGGGGVGLEMSCWVLGGGGLEALNAVIFLGLWDPHSDVYPGRVLMLDVGALHLR